MKITLEQSLASAIRFIQDNMEEGTEYYFGKIPENYFVPSVYFQLPFVTGEKATLRTYKQAFTLNVWFMASELWDAQKMATRMLEKIMLNSCIFPMVFKDGNKDEVGFRIKEPSIRKIEDGIVQLTFSFDAYFHPEKKSEKMQKIYIGYQNSDRR